MLDGKSAFDVVIHANLIRRLFQIGISKQSILLLQNLYQNAKSYIKWNGQISEEFFIIEQGVRQGGALSADLYKVYINPLLDILSNSGLGGKIGNINCCAPTCADDVALISNNPLELQTMIDIVVDFSKREGYLLQPTKSVVLPVKSKCKSMEINDGFWKLNNCNMPIVTQASHIGIQKSENCSAMTTVTENIRKARRALYSLMGTGLHGENGLDPETAMSMIRTFILPILTYGLEIVLPKGKNLDNINRQYKKWIKQILSLYINVADPAVFILAGTLPIEAEMHIKAITLYGNITRAKKSSIEWKLAERQLTIKSHESLSWFIEIKELCLKYDILNIYNYLENPLSKNQWKKMIKTKIYTYWKSRLLEEAKLYKSLKFMDKHLTFGKVHPLAKSTTYNIRDIARIPIRLKIVTGNYILQSDKSAFSKKATSPICLLCKKSEETTTHFLIVCEKLEETRTPILSKIIQEVSSIFAEQKLGGKIDLLQIIINPFAYVAGDEDTKLTDSISNSLEPICRQLLYALHNKRYALLKST